MRFHNQSILKFLVFSNQYLKQSHKNDKEIKTISFSSWCGICEIVSVPNHSIIWRSTSKLIGNERNQPTYQH